MFLRVVQNNSGNMKSPCMKVLPAHAGIGSSKIFGYCHSFCEMRDIILGSQTMNECQHCFRFSTSLQQFTQHHTQEKGSSGQFVPFLCFWRKHRRSCDDSPLDVVVLEFLVHDQNVVRVNLCRWFHVYWLILQWIFIHGAWTTTTRENISWKQRLDFTFSSGQWCANTFTFFHINVQVRGQGAVTSHGCIRYILPRLVWNKSIVVLDDQVLVWSCSSPGQLGQAFPEEKHLKARTSQVHEQLLSDLASKTKISQDQSYSRCILETPHNSHPGRGRHLLKRTKGEELCSLNEWQVEGMVYSWMGRAQNWARERRCCRATWKVSETSVFNTHPLWSNHESALTKVIVDYGLFSLSNRFKLHDAHKSNNRKENNSGNQLKLSLDNWPAKLVAWRILGD